MAQSDTTRRTGRGARHPANSGMIWRPLFSLLAARAHAATRGGIILLLCGLIITACAPQPTTSTGGSSSAKDGSSSIPTASTATSVPTASTAPTVSTKGQLFTDTTDTLASQMNTTGQATVNNIQLRVSIVCGPWVVLTPHSPTYTQSEQAAIRAFVMAHRGDIQGATENTNGYTLGAANPIPPTLRYVPGYPECSATYEVTNVGNALVQVSGAGFQPTQPPAVFAYHYNLLDACVYIDCTCPQCGGAFGCQYVSSIYMTMSQATAMGSLSSQNNSPDCPNITNVQPGATVPLYLVYFQPKGNQAVWFRGIPALQIVTDSGSTTQTYPTLVNNLVFDNFGDHTTGATVGLAIGSGAAQSPSIQVSCYTFSGSFKADAAFYLYISDTARETSPLCF